MDTFKLTMTKEVW